MTHISVPPTVMSVHPTSSMFFHPTSSMVFQFEYLFWSLIPSNPYLTFFTQNDSHTIGYIHCKSFCYKCLVSYFQFKSMSSFLIKGREIDVCRVSTQYTELLVQRVQVDSLLDRSLSPSSLIFVLIVFSTKLKTNFQ